MKRKELKNLAKKIAKLEKAVQSNSDQEATKKAQDELLHLCGQVTNLTDMLELDELIQEYIENES